MEKRNEYIGHYSNKIKEEIPKHQRKYFEFADFGCKELIGYKHILNLDTIHIKILLDKEMIANLLANYEYKNLSYNIKIPYRYSIQSSDKSVYMRLCKTVPGNTFNCEIQLQKGVVNGKFDNFNTLAKEIVVLLNNNQNYWISRIDLAFDYLLPHKWSFSLKRHGNQLRKAFDEYYYFNGSTNNKNKPTVHSHYNRNSKEVERVIYANRFEVKTFYQRKDKMRFDNINHNLIVSKLKKEIFVVHIEHVPGLTLEEKKLILQSKQVGTENSLQVFLTQQEYKKLRKKIVKCREPLEQIYLENSHLIYDFLLINEY